MTWEPICIWLLHKMDRRKYSAYKLLLVHLQSVEFSFSKTFKADEVLAYPPL